MRPTYWPTVLLAAKTDGSVFYDKLTPSISSEEMVGPIQNHLAISAHIIGRKTGSGQCSRANLAYNFP
jgi:hypothetical protein